MSVTTLDPDRVLADLRELAALTSDEAGAQRVAFTPMWDRAREWLRERLEELPVEVTEDSARNLWATLQGDEDPPLAVGSHIDSVPSGGWLDGVLGVLAGLEVLRAAGDRPPRSLTLVDWADEEGRFGHSLLGSSAAFGTLDEGALVAAGADGVLDLSRLPAAEQDRPELHSYVELHIEQGPVLEEAGVAIAAVRGAFGVRRRRIVFTGTPAHAGATPLSLRHDPVLAAARFALDARRLAAEYGGLATVGVLEAEPATPTAVAASCRLVVDTRHEQPHGLRTLDSRLGAAARLAAQQEGVAFTDERVWSIDPIQFDQEMVAVIEGIARGLGAEHPSVVSGPLHDAAQTALAGIPTAMIFVRSSGGISHSPAEDSSDDDLRLGITALAETVSALIG
jgi:N-carbamoyl-L-amino-acid hydrolase